MLLLLILPYAGDHLKRHFHHPAAHASAQANAGGRGGRAERFTGRLSQPFFKTFETLRSALACGALPGQGCACSQTAQRPTLGLGLILPYTPRHLERPTPPPAAEALALGVIVSEDVPS